MQITAGANILTELKKGNARALDTIFDLHYSSLCDFALTLLGDSQAAQDIVLEVFVIFWKKHSDFKSLGNIRAFLYISTKNACLNQLKKWQRDDAMRTGFIRLQDGEYEEFVLNDMIRSELLEKIYGIIETLPCQSKNVFKLCYLEGCCNTEVAERLSISVNTVKNHKCRALQQLREKCQGSFG